MPSHRRHHHHRHHRRCRRCRRRRRRSAIITFTQQHPLGYVGYVNRLLDVVFALSPPGTLQLQVFR